MRRYRCVRFEEIQQVCNSVIRNCVCVCSVYVLTLFFITGFLICHSFLDSLFRHFFAPFSILHCLKKKLKCFAA
jgi:hypothetical protein